MPITRRSLLRQTACLLLNGLAWSGLPAPVHAAVGANNQEPHPDLEVELTASEGLQQILPGAPTRVWRYTGRLRQGRDESLQEGDSYLGPLFRVRRGQRVRVRFRNRLPEKSVIHWHGLIVPPGMDGHPRDAVGTGGEYLYEFTVANRAGTYWYHPHPDRRTGPQVYFGLAGFFLVSDEEEDALGLPTGDRDRPLIIQDRTFDAANQLSYPGGMMGRMTGFRGNRILVNGRPDYVLAAATGACRLRLLNGSNSRIYRLAWEDGQALTVLATDGGLLAQPVERPYVLLAPGERIELWADFSRMDPGGEKKLISLPLELGGMGMMGRGMMGGMMGGGPAASDRFPILTVRIERREQETGSLPPRLAAIERFRPSAANNGDNPRLFQLSMQHMAWTINGRVFEMEAVTPYETVRFGDLELWEFAHGGMGMGMMGMMGMMRLPHPMHLHGVQFQVASRAGSPYPEGYVDEGWKDTVLVMPGERVQIMVRFADYKGLYLYHCHNLEHEDMGMMRNYFIE